MNHPATSVHNYLAKLVALQNVGAFRDGGRYTLDIKHEDWCDGLNGRGFCNCDCEITIRDGLHPPMTQS